MVIRIFKLMYALRSRDCRGTFVYLRNILLELFFRIVLLIIVDCLVLLSQKVSMKGIEKFLHDLIL